MNWINKKTIPFFMLAVVLIGGCMIFAGKLMPALGAPCPDIGGIDQVDIVMRERQQALITGWVASKTVAKGVHAMSGDVLLAQSALTEADTPPPSHDACTQRRMSRFQANVAIGDIPPSTTNIDVIGMSADRTSFPIQSVPFRSPAVFGNLDLKKYESGHLTLEGWALSANGALRILVLDRNGREIARTETGIARPDVARAWPAWAGAKLAGFKLQIPTPVEDVRILVQNRHGESADLHAEISR